MSDQILLLHGRGFQGLDRWPRLGYLFCSRCGCAVGNNFDREYEGGHCPSCGATLPAGLQPPTYH